MNPRNVEINKTSKFDASCYRNTTLPLRAYAAAVYDLQNTGWLQFKKTFNGRSDFKDIFTRLQGVLRYRGVGT